MSPELYVLWKPTIQNSFIPVKGKAFCLYLCTKCEFITMRPDTRRKHILRHMRERIFKFNHCNFPSSLFIPVNGKLKAHQLVHSDQKHFTCTECEDDIWKHFLRWHTSVTWSIGWVFCKSTSKWYIVWKNTKFKTLQKYI